MVAVFGWHRKQLLTNKGSLWGHRDSAGSTTRARRAWSRSVPAGTLQETTPCQWPAGDHPVVLRAGKGSER